MLGGDALVGRVVAGGADLHPRGPHPECGHTLAAPPPPGWARTATPERADPSTMGPPHWWKPPEKRPPSGGVQNDIGSADKRPRRPGPNPPIATLPRMVQAPQRIDVAQLLEADR